MGKVISGKKIAKNMFMSVGVQAVSLIVGFILNLIVPKFISELDYSYWHMVLLYVQYTGMLHFGFLDGFVLRYSQYDYNELDKKLIRSQYSVIMAIDLAASAGMLVIGFVAFSGINRMICLLTAFATCIAITHHFVSFSFQTTNRIREYARYILVYRCVYCALILLCIVGGFEKYYWFCLASSLSEAAVILWFGLKYNRELFIGPRMRWSEVKGELKETLSAGIWLMISSYAANFLIGSGKMVIQWFWGEYAFGKVSLAFSLCSFVLQFVTAISVVLFPSMKRMKAERLPDMYVQIRNGISPLLFLCLVFYYPGSIILKLWLPQYAQSVVYLGILMPIIIFSSKVSLLTNNYLKAYRKEKMLLIINLTIVIASFLVFLLLGMYVKSIEAMLISILIAIMIRSVVAEMAVAKLINRHFYGDFIMEFVMTAVFVCGTIMLEPLYAFAVYCAAFLVYCICKRAALKQLIGRIVKKKEGKNA